MGKIACEIILNLYWENIFKGEQNDEENYYNPDCGVFFYLFYGQ